MRIKQWTDMPRDRTPRRQAAAVAASRVKEAADEDGGDSEWDEPEESSVEEDELEEVHDEADEDPQYSDEEEDVDEPRKKTAAKKSASRKLKAPVNDSDYEDDDDVLPTYARKTSRGGYAHTNKSRARISKANKGNTPWNKGKIRSDAVRAKIAAGVRARNRAVLLEKLKKLGMTEEEWFAKKKEIKYLRERVRKAKKAAAKREDKNKGGKSKEQTYAELQDQLAAELAEQMNAIQPKEDDRNNAESVDEETQEEVAIAPALLQQVFAPAVEWASHDYDAHDNLYEQLCPTGGPGGLICCQTCASAYSRYLTQTANDIEVQTIHNIGKEVQELVGFMEETRSKLQDKIGLARQQGPPPQQRGFAQGTAQVASRMPKGDWNLKTAMGPLGPTVRL